MFNWKASKKEPDQEEEKIVLPDQNPETEEDLQPAQELKEAGIAVQEKPEAAKTQEKVYHGKRRNMERFGRRLERVEPLQQAVCCCG